MWVMTTRGFYSAVQHREDPTRVMVRARCKEDIDALAELIPNAEPYELLLSDYAWRIETSQAEWVEALVQMSLDVDYDNFKNAVKSKKHKDAYMNVWFDLLDLEEGGHPLYGGSGQQFSWGWGERVGDSTADENVEWKDEWGEWEDDEPFFAPPLEEAA